MKRVHFDGCPNKVNAHSTDRNRRNYAEYGNHPSVYKHPDLTKKAIQKDVLRNFSLPASPAVSPFIPNTHQNPQGLVTPVDKSARQICDESFHPTPDSMAANDWVTTATEPEIFFPGTFICSLIWIYNMRITFPFLEIYLGDDDVSGAFRHSKFNPNVVGMHTFMLFGFLFLATGLTFGGVPHPANWEVFALTRMTLARYFWGLDDIVSRALPFLPKITFAPPPTPEDIRAFTPADRDSLNQGVLHPDGSRKPPLFRHHVDDCIYADIQATMIQTVSASVIALYTVLGYPNAAKGIRDCVSWEKFQSTFTHRRHTLGWDIDSRRLTVGLPHKKKLSLLARLQTTLESPRLTIRELAVLLGHLGNATTVKRDMRCSFFNLERVLRMLLHSRYHATVGWFSRRDRVASLQKQFPDHLHHQLEGIVSRQVANYLWNNTAAIRLDEPVLRELRRIKLSLESEPWEIFIPQMIPRDPHFVTHGDASFIGGGAVSQSLNYWFRLVWSPDLVRRLHLHSSHPDYVHINCLEFLVSLLQVVAAIVTFEDYADIPADQLPAFLAAVFPSGLPRFPVVEVGTDNKSTKAWTNNVRTTSALARALVHLLGQLLNRNLLTVLAEYIEGAVNIVPDFISRPDQTDSHLFLLAQTFQEHPWMRNLRFFRPSPALLSALQSCLSYNSNRDLPRIPKKLGHFDPAGSTTSAFVSL